MRTHGPGRGSRYNIGVLSGVTFATIPSGTTLDKNSMTVPAIDTGYGTAVKWVFGTIDSENDRASGATPPQSGINNRHSISTGLSSIIGFYGTYLIDSGCSLILGKGTPVSPEWSWSASGGGVSVFTYSQCTPGLILVNGVSLQYIAFGT